MLLASLDYSLLRHLLRISILCLSGSLNPLLFLMTEFLNSAAINAQQLPQYRIRYAITENQKADLKIGRLDEDLAQTPSVRDTELYRFLRATNYGVLRYRLGPQAPGGASDLFQLNETSSVLSTRVSVDLEALCPRYCRQGVTRAQLPVIVQIWHNDRSLARVHVEVTVIDVDDNPPKFPATVARPYRLRLKEVIYRAGQQVELPRARDADIQPEHATIAYRLESHPEDRSHALEVFHLLVKNDSRLMLVLQRDLDYEVVRLYRFFLVAWSPRAGDDQMVARPQGISSDGALLGMASPYRSRTPSLSFQDQLEIQVEVLNINDIEPVFAQSVYKVEIREDAVVGALVHKLEATDQDANSTIHYSLETTGVDSVSEALFKVHTDGRVTLASPLDFEQRRVYSLGCRASDGEFYALTRLEVTVLDVNDEAPEFVTEPRQLAVRENAPEQTLVGKLSIIDRDSPAINGLVRCHEPANLAGNQAIIFVPDTSMSASSRRLGQPTATPDLTTIHADHTMKVYLRYTIYTRVQFDREAPTAAQAFGLLVCSDGGQSMSGVSSNAEHASTATLTISLTVLDENDNAPEFEKAHYEVELMENRPIGTRVIQVRAKDADSAPYARPQYKLLQNELLTMQFDVEPETGWIVTRADIDRETQARYHLTVLAVDGILTPDSKEHPSTPTSLIQHTATAHVNIKIQDENDNAPEFRGSRQFAVEENQPGGIWIGDLQTIDRDEGLNRAVRYKMSSVLGVNESLVVKPNGNDVAISPPPTPHSLPIVLRKNGSLYTTEPLDREVESHYCFEVIVQDQSPDKPLSSADTICVRVLDRNDNAPGFGPVKGSVVDSNDTVLLDPNGNPIVRVSSNEAPGYCALIAQAKDSDEGRNALLRYTIEFADVASNLPPTTDQRLMVHPADAFLMDAHTGRVMLTRILTRQDLGEYLIRLIVQDSGTPMMKDEQIILIEIADIPARGNWLLLQADSELAPSGATQTRDTGRDVAEANTILVVIGLSGIASFLAAVLVSAILCMIKPCRRGSRTDRSSPNRFGKDGSMIKQQQQQLNSTGNQASTYYAPGPNYDDEADYGLGMLHDGNACYMGSLDWRTQSRNALLTATNTTTSIPGLEPLYLPPEKLIGIDTEVNPLTTIVTSDGVLSEEASWSGQTHTSTLISSPLMGRSSPLGAYQIGPPMAEGNWIDGPMPRTIWNLIPSGAANAQSCVDCQLVLHPDCSTATATMPIALQDNINNGNTFTLHRPSSSVNQQPLGYSAAHHRSSMMHWDGVSSPTPDGQSATTMAVVTRGHGGGGVMESNGNGGVGAGPVGGGEEQRSDSGRGASDEEVAPPGYGQGNPTAGFVGQAWSGRQCHSISLKTFNEHRSHMVPGLLFPSLPRFNPKFMDESPGGGLSGSQLNYMTSLE